MSELMKAAVVRAFGAPLTIEDMPVPAPGPGEVLVKIHACGVCHTDLMQPKAIGPSSRPCHSSPAMKVQEP